MPPPPRTRYWRGPVLSLFNGREWRTLSPRLGGRLATSGGPVTRYTVTLEANDHPWLFALDFPASLPDIDQDTGTRGAAGGFAGYSREQQFLMRAGVTQPLRYTVESRLTDSYPAASQQEAITNAVRHSGGSRIQVRLDYRPADVVLSVADDGHGFDYARAASQPNGHYGLITMKERAAEIGGTLSIEPRAPAGTQVRMVVPQSARVQERVDVGA